MTDKIDEEVEKFFLTLHVHDNSASSKLITSTRGGSTWTQTAFLQRGMQGDAPVLYGGWASPHDSCCYYQASTGYIYLKDVASINPDGVCPENGRPVSRIDFR